MSYHWEALNGTSIIACGLRRSGKPNNVLALNVLVVLAEADAKLLTKQHPSLKFVRKGRK